MFSPSARSVPPLGLPTVMALAFGLFAEAIGLHVILGAYLAGLFFEEKVAHPNLVRIVKGRAYGIAYSFLGPIFFISPGFSITFDISAATMGFIALLTVAVIVGQWVDDALNRFYDEFSVPSR